MTDPVVNILQGTLRGYISEAARGGKFYSFLGIPYGKPPVGNLRFKAPQPADSWEGVRDATVPGNTSIQSDFFTRQLDGSEDCLNLNVYTPQLPSSNCSNNPPLKPVMVFIHGGSFLFGSNRPEMYGPEVLIAEDVVVVAINYRLGILGMLSLKDPKLEVPGNAAFKDMVLALKWVKNNIKLFLGDPNNVTIFGNSAGAASTHLLVLSPMAKGLFHKAICQSGSALCSWLYAVEDATELLAKTLSLDGLNESELLIQLQAASPDEILKAQKYLNKMIPGGNRYRYFGAVIEPKSVKEIRFLPEHPVDIISQDIYHHVPLIMGYNTGDGMILDALVHPTNNHKYWNETELNVPGLLELPRTSRLHKDLGDEIIKFYLGTGPISRDTHLQQLYDLTTDNLFLRGMYKAVCHHSRKSNVYVYRLSLESDLCFYKKLLKIQTPGVCHADELGYIFRTILNAIPEPGSIEDVAQRRFCRLWSNFAKFSNPTPHNDPLLNISWPSIKNVQRIPFMDIAEDLTIQHNPEENKMKFWDKIYSHGRHASKL